MFSNPSGRQGMSIFNRRRRPRQAVYASPQSQSLETTLQTEVPDQQLADMVQDFDTGPGNYNFVSSTRPLAHYSNTSSSRPLQTSQTRRFSLQKHPNNPFNNENNEAKFESNYFGTRPNNGKSSGQQQAIMDTKPGWYNTGNNFPSREQTLTKKPFSFEKNPMKQQSNLGQNQYSWTNNTNSPVQAAKAGGNARQLRQNERASFSTPQNQYKKIEVEIPKNETTGAIADTFPLKTADTFPLKTVDKSMKFVTSTIKGMRKWSEHREQLPLVFEVFATLDSVPTSNNNGTSKLFTVQDSTGGIRCIYWEMDQKLPRMARGQMYRLVGALDRKTGHMQCFTIRQAQPDEEQVATSKVTICDNVLTKVVSMIAEA